MDVGGGGRRTKLRVVLIGNFGVGKTSLLRQYLDRTFSSTPSNTIQEDERETTITIDSYICDVIVTDTAGQEQFRSFTSSYFRDKHGALAVFDVSNPQTLIDLEHWIREIRKWDEHTDIIVVGNKIDLEPRKVSTREGEEFAQSIKVLIIPAFCVGWGYVFEFKVVLHVNLTPSPQGPLH